MMTLVPFPFAATDVIGVLGFCIYMLTYSLLTLRLLPSSSPRYFMLNLTASSCVLIGLTGSFNLAAALIQSFWMVMSLVGLALHVWRPHRVQPA